MIDLTQPIDFKAALEKLDSKQILASPLSTKDLQTRTDADLLDRSFFASRVANPVLLQQFKDAVNEVIAGNSDEATQRLQMEKAAEKLGARDLLTNARLQLILRTNSDLVRGFGQWQESNAVAEAFPASELIRFGYRKVPRKWFEIWDEARLSTPRTSALPSAIGRLIALKGDPIWLEISDFGVPWAPFKYNSGMGLVNVDWDECLDLGLVKEGETIKPTPRIPMNKNVSGSVAGVSPDLLAVFGTLTGLSLVGTEIYMDQDDSFQNRSESEVVDVLCT